MRNGHAGAALEQLFSDLSEQRVTYQKVPHGVALTEWLIENAPGELAEVADLLLKVIEGTRVTGSVS